jgi:hypothetical protein
VTQALSEDKIAGVIREVTDAEVAFYEEPGWVKLDGLLTPAFAAEMLDVARSTCQAQAADGGSWFGMGYPAMRSIEPFRSFMFSELDRTWM